MYNFLANSFLESGGRGAGSAPFVSRKKREEEKRGLPASVVHDNWDLFATFSYSIVWQFLGYYCLFWGNNLL